VQLPPDSELKVDAELSPRGAGGAAWYQKWYVITGAVVLGGLVGGGIYFATREPPNSVDVGGVFK
jgi:hypothetical protein